MFTNDIWCMRHAHTHIHTHTHTHTLTHTLTYTLTLTLTHTHSHIHTLTLSLTHSHSHTHSHTHTHTHSHSHTLTGSSPYLIPPKSQGLREEVFIVLATDSNAEGAASVLKIEDPTISTPTTAAPGHPSHPHTCTRSPLTHAPGHPSHPHTCTNLSMVETFFLFLFIT